MARSAQKGPAAKTTKVEPRRMPSAEPREVREAATVSPILEAISEHVSDKNLTLVSNTLHWGMIFNGVYAFFTLFVFVKYQTYMVVFYSLTSQAMLAIVTCVVGGISKNANLQHMANLVQSIKDLIRPPAAPKQEQ